MGEEGKAVRQAMDGPDVEHDELIEFVSIRNREDKERASSSAESRQKIGVFIDETGLNGKALSWLRQIVKTRDKPSGQAKAMDIIRSLEYGLPMVKAEIAGQPDLFDAPADPLDPADTEADVVGDFDNVVPFDGAEVA